jgi:hypothetical protein
MNYEVIGSTILSLDWTNNTICVLKKIGEAEQEKIAEMLSHQEGLYPVRGSLFNSGVSVAGCMVSVWQSAEHTLIRITTG